MKKTKGCALYIPWRNRENNKVTRRFFVGTFAKLNLFGEILNFFFQTNKILLFSYSYMRFIFYELSSDYPSVITLSSPCRNISNERKTLKNSSGNDHKNSMIAWKKDFNILTKFIGKIDLTIRDRGTNSIFVLFFLRNQIVFFREADIS